MKAFAVFFLAVLCLCSGARFTNLKSLSINQSMRQGNTSPFQSFSNFNRRVGPRLPAINLNCLDLKYRTFSGSCNNIRNPKWGARDEPFRLIATPVVFDDITKLPNARTVSNIVCRESNPIPNRRRMSELVTFFGQFVDHTVTETAVESSQTWNIPIPANDPVFPAGQSLEFLRSTLAGTGTERAPRNFLSSYLDAASVYGAEEKVAKDLRSMVNGKMRLDANGFLTKKGRFFVSGDARVNENPLLTSIHTLFTREHNVVADEVKAAYPAKNDEQIYQLARKIVTAEFQAIVFHEFLPAMTGRTLGRVAYNPREKGSISNTFSTVGFRVGHTLINPKVTSIDNAGTPKTRMLRDSFFNPEAFVQDGMDSLFRGMMRTRASEVDNGITSAVRDFLISSEEHPTRRLDLAALNIQRGRDHGVPTYNRLRTFYGLRPLKSFAEITSNVGLQVKLEKAYDQNINLIDPWVGGIAEDQTIGSLGGLFGRIWLREFKRLRDGDRFYFENPNHFSADEISKLSTVNGLVGNRNLIGKVMQRVLKRNTKISNVPAKPFFVS